MEENVEASQNDSKKFIRRRVSLAPSNSDVQSTATSPRPIARKAPKPAVEKLTSLIVDSDSQFQRLSSSARPSEAVSSDDHNLINGHRTKKQEDSAKDEFTAADVTNSPNIHSELPQVSKPGGKRLPGSELSPSKLASSPVLSPVTSPRATARQGSRPAVQKLSSALDVPEISLSRPRDQDILIDDRARQRNNDQMKSGLRASTPTGGNLALAQFPGQGREGKMSPQLDPLNPYVFSTSNDRPGMDSVDAIEKQRPSLEKRPGLQKSAGSGTNVLQSPNTSPRAFARKLPKPAVDKLSSPLDVTPIGNQRQRGESLGDAKDLHAKARTSESPSRDGGVNTIESPKSSPRAAARKGGRPVLEKFSSDFEPFIRPATADPIVLKPPETDVLKTETPSRSGTTVGGYGIQSEFPADVADGGESQRPKRSYSATYRLPSRIQAKSESISPPRVNEELEHSPTSDIEFPTQKCQSEQTEISSGTLDDVSTANKFYKNSKASTSCAATTPALCERCQSEPSIEAERMAHSEELKAMKTKMKELESKMRGIISKQDEDMTHERGEVAELAKQFAAACKLIESMKKQLKVVMDENVDLKNKVSLDEQGSKAPLPQTPAQIPVQEKQDDLADANKKVRLAQEQMAKLIARHSKEVSTWSNTCDELKRTVEKGKSVESDLRQEVKMLQTIIKTLEEQTKQSIDKLDGNGVSVAVQTDDRTRGKWNSWVWLVSLSIWAANRPGPTESVEIQTDLTLATHAKARQKDASTLTVQDTVTFESDFDRWWYGVLDSCEDELKTLKFRSTTQLSKPQLLSLIANVYAEKIVQDEVDDREGLPRMELPNFLHLFFLDQKGTAIGAQRAIVIAISNILAHLRGQILVNGTDHADEETSLTNGFGKPPASLGRNARIVLFARFLGLKHDGLEPIPVEGLNLYLAALARTQKGHIPLLPISGEKVLINSSDFAQTLDWIFGQTRTIIRESVKVGLLSLRADPLDLETALEYTLEQWKECVAKTDARLEALFSTVVAVADYAFETFDEMMQKLKVDEPVLPGHTSRLRMFQELCLYSRVDSTIFSKIAKKYGIFKFNIGSPPGMGKIDLDASALFDSLAPLYSAALRTISGKLPELDQSGRGRGIEKKWSICGELLKERECPEKAWIFYHMVTRQYSSSMRMIKTRGAKGNSNLTTADFETFQAEPAVVVKKQRERSSFARVSSSGFTPSE